MIDLTSDEPTIPEAMFFVAASVLLVAMSVGLIGPELSGVSALFGILVGSICAVVGSLWIILDAILEFDRGREESEEELE